MIQPWKNGIWPAEGDPFGLHKCCQMMMSLGSSPSLTSQGLHTSPWRARLVKLFQQLANIPTIFAHRKARGMLRIMLQKWNLLFCLVHSGRENAVLSALFPTNHTSTPPLNALWRVCRPQLPTTRICVPANCSACSFCRRSTNFQWTESPSIDKESKFLRFRSFVHSWNEEKHKHYKNSQLIPKAMIPRALY